MQLTKLVSCFLRWTLSRKTKEQRLYERIQKHSFEKWIRDYEDYS